jgi:hypothetical protein
LEALFVRTNIFPSTSTTESARDFDENFFWSEVKKPKATGLESDKKKEEVIQSLGKRALHNVLCVSEDVRFDFTEFEEVNDTQYDDDDRSIVSSVVSRAGASRADMHDESEDDDDEQTDKKAATTLQQLGNVKKK